MGRRSAKEPLVTLALDRIREISIADDIQYVENHDFDAEEHFKNVIGVTVEQGKRPQRVHTLCHHKASAPNPGSSLKIKAWNRNYN